MAKILKEGRINVIECGKCKSVVEFRIDDIRYYHEMFPEPIVETRYFYIDCPLCGEELYVEPFMSKDLLKKSRKKFSA